VKEFNQLEKNNGTQTLERVAESIGISQTRLQVIPGRFYSFKVKSPIPNLTRESIQLNFKKPYYDVSPTGLLFFHDNWKETAILLNLKIIPPSIGAKILEAYWNFSKMNGLASLFDREGALISLEQRRLIDQKFYLLTPSIFSNILGANNLNYAINKYNMDDILDAKLIDWDNFGMLIKPLASTTGLFPNPINLSKVYEDFLTNTLG
jgi:hypothetical protein